MGVIIKMQLDTLSVTYHYGSKIRLTPKWHDKNVVVPNSKIYYVLSGEITVCANGERLVAKRGDAILIPAGIKHDYFLENVESAEKYWFHFDLRNGSSGFFESVTIPYITHLGTDEDTINLFESAVAFNSTGKIKDSLESLSAVLSIIARYLESCGYKETEKGCDDEIDLVIKEVKRSYSESYTLNRLAKIAKLAPNYFSKKFKERTGYPPLKYVNTLRIERAKFLLEHTKMPISEIMESVGILDASHFSKLFRATTGYSPKRFRQSFEKK